MMPPRRNSCPNSMPGSVPAAIQPWPCARQNCQCCILTAFTENLFTRPPFSFIKGYKQNQFIAVKNDCAPPPPQSGSSKQAEREPTTTFHHSLSRPATTVIQPGL